MVSPGIVVILKIPVVGYVELYRERESITAAVF
jgi:hypothetical protein